MNFSDRIFSITTQCQFEELALEIFWYQAKANPVYATFLKYLKKDLKNINTVAKIPFLPVELFKSHKVISGDYREKMVFTSSGTTGLTTSSHHVTDLEVYKTSIRCGFERFYGKVSDYIFLAILPSYLERDGSSLVYMVDYLIKQSNHPGSGFYLYNIEELVKTLQKKPSPGKQFFLLGVSFALLEMAEKFNLSLYKTIVMETGGMKGRRPEITRQELHSVLIKRLEVNTIHSEYGMTEMLSQAYSKGDGIFECPPWMKILIRDPDDPFNVYSDSGRGGINVVDLANFNSCSFIATSDLGKLYSNGTFEVLGRFDYSDIRGCNLLVEG